MHLDIDLRQISAATGFSAAYLEKLFKKHYRLTVSKKLNELRIRRAKHMIKDFSISELTKNRLSTKELYRL